MAQRRKKGEIYSAAYSAAKISDVIAEHPEYSHREIGAALGIDRAYVGILIARFKIPYLKKDSKHLIRRAQNPNAAYTGKVPDLNNQEMIALINGKARAAGMTYGQYVAFCKSYNIPLY